MSVGEWLMFQLYGGTPPTQHPEILHPHIIGEEYIMFLLKSVLVSLGFSLIFLGG